MLGKLYKNLAIAVGSFHIFVFAFEVYGMIKYGKQPNEGV